jgi:sigma-54 interacting transcriptional regulator
MLDPCGPSHETLDIEMLQPVVTVEKFVPTLVHHHESTLLRARHPHVLVVGPQASAVPALAQLRPYLRSPLSHWRPAVAADPPQAPKGALIIWNVEALDLEQQQCLLAWMDERAADLQIVSIAESPLFPLVRRKMFLEDLYYRLNMVSVMLLG